MSNNDLKFTSGDHAVQLDLIGTVRGVESAGSYFSSLRDEYKTEKTYGALLNCYVREGLIDKSLSILQKMREMGFLSSSLNYNCIMCLYAKTGQFEKVPEVFSEMKEHGINPDNYSYRLCMTSYASRSNLDGVEKVLQEMESKPHISMDWLTYSMVANYYIKSGLNGKALHYLRKCEEKVDKDALGYNHLISSYASLGNKDEMMRFWRLQKAACKKQINRDYITMLGSLVKIGDIEEAEELLKEWESSCQTFDFRVPNILLIGYSQKGLVEKAEAALRDIVRRQKNAIPIPNSWAIIAAGYVSKNNMEKAVECFKEALAVEAENPGWRPKLPLISSLLSWLGDYGDVEEVEAFVKLLNTKVPRSKEMYDALMKAYIRAGKDGHVNTLKSALHLFN
ncbi:hypothetical protein SLEP1_g46262 [Rubroshorea leprosula]|uniref:Pentatricopeptide repeat-containing protein n=1 Tax=Rubroshorea leprosula TaxID=152421 RepID=A0AAV5LMK0_9ROSI|nr:hypothetical protein SLEP1_g46262 [Rubroshorea leprosula]